MANAVKGLFGPSDAEKAQQRQIREQRRKQDRVEAGQVALREGGRGLLAFVDDELTGLFGGRRTRRKSALTSAAKTLGGDR
jgi:hypothetical protein